MNRHWKDSLLDNPPDYGFDEHRDRLTRLALKRFSVRIEVVFELWQKVLQHENPNGKDGRAIIGKFRGSVVMPLCDAIHREYRRARGVTPAAREIQDQLLKATALDEKLVRLLRPEQEAIQ